MARWTSRRKGLADGPLTRLGAAALTSEAGPLTGDDVHLEVGRATGRALEAVIAAGVIGAAVRFELVDEIEDVEGHRQPPCARICARPARWPVLIPVLPMSRAADTDC